MDDGLGVGVGLEDVALGGELGLELAIVLDDAVVHDRDLAVMCGCALRSVGRPCVAQRVWPMPAWPGERLGEQPVFEVAELALGAAALEMAVLDGRDAGRVIAAIFEPAQRVDEIGRDRLLPDNANDAAHAMIP